MQLRNKLSLRCNSLKFRTSAVKKHQKPAAMPVGIVLTTYIRSDFSMCRLEFWYVQTLKILPIKSITSINQGTIPIINCHIPVPVLIFHYLYYYQYQHSRQKSSINGTCPESGKQNTRVGYTSYIQEQYKPHTYQTQNSHSPAPCPKKAVKVSNIRTRTT